MVQMTFVRKKNIFPLAILPNMTNNISPIGSENKIRRLIIFIEFDDESFKNIKALEDKQNPKKFEPQSPIM